MTVASIKTARKRNRIRDLLYPFEMETGRVLSFFVYNRNQWRSSLYTAMPFHASVEREKNESNALTEIQGDET